MLNSWTLPRSYCPNVYAVNTTYIPTKEQYLPSALTQPEFYLDYNVMVRIFWHTIQMSRNCNISNNSRGSVSLWLLLMVKPLPFGKFLQMCSLQFAYWIIQIPELLWIWFWTRVSDISYSFDLRQEKKHRVQDCKPVLLCNLL